MVTANASTKPEPAPCFDSNPHCSSQRNTVSSETLRYTWNLQHHGVVVIIVGELRWSELATLMILNERYGAGDNGVLPRRQP
jgi:hypothetical protein